MWTKQHSFCFVLFFFGFRFSDSRKSPKAVDAPGRRPGRPVKWEIYFYNPQPNGKHDGKSRWLAGCARGFSRARACGESVRWLNARWSMRDHADRALLSIAASKSPAMRSIWHSAKARNIHPMFEIRAKPTWRELGIAFVMNTISDSYAFHGDARLPFFRLTEPTVID